MLPGDSCNGRSERSLQKKPFWCIKIITMELGERRTFIIVAILVIVGVALVFILQRGAGLGGILGSREAPMGGSLGIPSADEPLTEGRGVGAAAPGSARSIRAFDLTAAMTGFEPDKIVVEEGDTVTLYLTAEAEGFDITIPALGLHQTAVVGEERIMQFQAGVAGTYPFMCVDTCPGGRKLEGLLLIKKVGE